ncbi:Uncharacterized protein LW93_2860 [Fusarium fujikuroi]|nr:Uncharacterized protein LW93_2860 [Fusarium fujikuroi]
MLDATCMATQPQFVSFAPPITSPISITIRRGKSIHHLLSSAFYLARSAGNKSYPRELPHRVEVLPRPTIGMINFLRALYGKDRHRLETRGHVRISVLGVPYRSRELRQVTGLLIFVQSQLRPFNMAQLSTDAVITLVSTIPGLIVSCLSAWFAYLALHRRPIPQSDVETAAMLFMIPRAFSIPPRFAFTCLNNILGRAIPECLNMLNVYHNIVMKNTIQIENALFFNASTWAAVHTTQLVSPSHCPSPNEAFSLGSHTLINQPDTTVHYDLALKGINSTQMDHEQPETTHEEPQENGFIHLKAFLARGHFLD